MKNHLLAFFLGATAALAQPAITPPTVGTVHDSSGSLHAVIGVPGNFVLADTGISNVVSAAFSGSAGLVKTGSELLVLDSGGQVTARYATPAGRALCAFDSSGAPALVYYSGTLFQFDNNVLRPVNWTGEALSIALASPQSAVIIVRSDDRLRKVNVTLATGAVESETGIGDVSGPLLLLSNGWLLFTRDNDLIVHDSSGAERLMPIAFKVGSFEAMGTNWIAVREAAGGRLFALHITTQNLDLYQLPEVSQ